MVEEIGSQETLDNAFQMIWDSFLKDVHTIMPAQVTAFDAATQSISVQPAFKRKYKGQDPVNLPIIEDVPVVYPGSSGYHMTYAIDVGSFVVLLFAERAMGAWLQAGGIVDPQVARTHSLSDAIALPGLNPFSSPIASGVKADTMEIRNAAGTEYISLSTGAAEVKTLGTIKLETAAATIKGTATTTIDSPAIFLGLGALEPLVKGTVFSVAFGTYVADIASAASTWSSTVPPTDASNGTFIAALIAATSKLGLAIPTMLSATSKTL